MPLSRDTVHGWIMGWAERNKRHITTICQLRRNWADWARNDLVHELMSLPGNPRIERNTHDYHDPGCVSSIRVTPGYSYWGNSPILVEFQGLTLTASPPGGTKTATESSRQYHVQEQILSGVSKLRERVNKNHRPMVITMVVTEKSRPIPEIKLSPPVLREDLYCEQYVISVFRCNGQ